MKRRYFEQSVGKRGKWDWQKFFPVLVFFFTSIGFHFREVFFGEAYLFSDHIHLMGRLYDIYTSPSPWNTFQWTEKLYFGFSYAREAGGIFFHFPECFLMRVFPPFKAILISSIFWFFVAQMFAYLFHRLFKVSRLAAMIGAIMFTFSGTITHQYVHYDHLIVATTTPLLFWLTELLARRCRFPLAIAISFVISNNCFNVNIQWVCYQISIITIYYIIRVLQLHGIKKGVRRWFAFLGILIFAILLSTPYLLPFSDQIFGSVTKHGRGGAYSLLGKALGGSRWSRLWLFFYSLFAPKAVGSDVPHATIPSLVSHSWTWRVYVGLLPWFCFSSLWKEKRRAELLCFFGITVLSFWFFVPNLLVPILPDFRTLYSYIPGWNMFHNYERFFFLGTFSMSVLLTRSIDSWSRKPDRFGILFPFVLLAVLGGISITSSLFEIIPEWLPTSLYHSLNSLSIHSGGNFIMHTKLGSALSIFLLLSFILVVGRAWFRLPRSAFLWLTIILLTSDLMWFGLPLKPTLDIQRFLSPKPKLAQFIPGGDRFISATARTSWIWNRDMSPFESRRFLGTNFNLFFDLNAIGGLTLPVLSKEEYPFFNLMLAEVPIQGQWYKREISEVNQFMKVLDLWRLYAIEYVITDMEVKHSNFSFVEQDGEYRLYKIIDSFPRAFCSSDISDIRLAQDRKLGNGFVVSISGGNTNLTVEVEVEAGGTFLVLTDRWSKEWHATIEGNEIPIYRVNGLQRGVFVQEGNHTVDFHYYDRQLVDGLKLAGLSLALIAIFFIRSVVIRVINSNRYNALMHKNNTRENI